MAWKAVILSMMLAFLLSVAGCATLTDLTAENHLQVETIE